MVVDTSALLAVLLQEPEAEGVAKALEAASTRLLSAATLLEASIVIESRKGEAGRLALDLPVVRAAIEVVPVDEHQAQIARTAWRQFGKGRHPASLNFGDCFA